MPHPERHREHLRRHVHLAVLVDREAEAGKVRERAKGKALEIIAPYK